MSDNVITYELNELIMCKSRYEDVFGYPAKILAIDDKTPGEKFYRIHYMGWHSRYDAWFSQDDVPHTFFKHTPEIEAEHKKLEQEIHGKTAKKKKALQTPARSLTKGRERQGSTARTRSTKRELVIPDKLKALLLDDSHIVNQQGRLAKLPAHFTIDKIVKDYADSLAARKDIPDIAKNEEEEGAEGSRKRNDMALNKHDLRQSSLAMADYFNTLLDVKLLYECERDQYNLSCVDPPVDAQGQKVDSEETPELKGVEIIPSSIYGIGHLTRLFVAIGPLLAADGYRGKSLTLLNKHMTDFMTFLSNNSLKYYNIYRDYEDAPTTSTGAIAQE